MQVILYFLFKYFSFAFAIFSKLGNLLVLQQALVIRLAVARIIVAIMLKSRWIMYHCCSFRPCTDTQTTFIKLRTPRFHTSHHVYGAANCFEQPSEKSVKSCSTKFQGSCFCAAICCIKSISHRVIILLKISVIFLLKGCKC